MAVPDPRAPRYTHFIVGLILDTATNAIVGESSTELVLDRDPASRVEVDEISAELTRRSRRNGTLRANRRITVISWQRFGVPSAV